MAASETRGPTPLKSHNLGAIRCMDGIGFCAFSPGSCRKESRWQWFLAPTRRHGYTVYSTVASSESSTLIIFLFSCRSNWQFGMVILWLWDAVWDSMSHYVCLSLLILSSQLIYVIRLFRLVGGHSVFLWPRAGGHCLNSSCSFWWLSNTRALAPLGELVELVEHTVEEHIGTKGNCVQLCSCM